MGMGSVPDGNCHGHVAGGYTYAVRMIPCVLGEFTKFYAYVCDSNVGTQT